MELTAGEHVKTSGCPGRAELSVALAAAMAAGTGWTLAWSAGIDPAVRSGSGSLHVSLVSVIVTTIAVAVVGGALLRILERRMAGALRIWTFVAAAVLVVSLVGPLGAVSASAGAVLAGLHLLVGTVVVAGYRRSRLGSRP